MAKNSRKLSAEGLKIVEGACQHKGWNKVDEAWLGLAEVSKSTFDRFWIQTPIKHKNFVAICKAVGVDWEQVVDLPAIEPTNITRKSNLAQVNQPVILKLEEFGQQIFDWFRALRFEIEGDPKYNRTYVEAIIRVPGRSGFERVLVQIVTHEAVLTDLDGLRQAVDDPRRQVDGGWLITKSWVSQAVKDALKESGDRRLTCLTFDELIDQDAKFEPYLDWLEREISKIDRYYVDLGCTKGEFDADTRTLRGTSKYSVADGGIDRYIDRWLENPVKEHVSILGEFGTGKTWFALHYAGKCLQDYQAAKSNGLPRPRLPLVIPLRDYAKALNVENVLAGFFYTQHNIRLNSDVFDRLNQMGKLLLIFDGFDEMADKIDTQKMTDNFWELAKVVTPNAKVILTCRTEHFPTAQDGRENLSGKRMPSTANKIPVAPKFETLELMKFDDAQIREVLSRRTNPATVELVMANSQLLDLLQRAVMAEFVLEALPEIEAGKPIDLARVYLYAVRHKMERDITTGRTFTSLADKLYFLCELAWEMLSEDKMSLNYREFPDRLRVLFKHEVKEQKHLDHWHYDMMGRTMLIRNDDGDYSPAHRSLLEFFVAYKFAAELGLLADDFLEMAQNQSGIDESLEPQFYTWSDYWRRDVNDKGERELIAPLAGFKSELPEKLRDTFGKSPLTKAILDLLLPALNLEVKVNREPNSLIDLIKSTQAIDVEYSGGNAATILVNLESNALEYQDLSGTNLAYANLVNARLRGTDLSETNLENCLTTRVFGSVNAIVMSKDNQHFITAHNDNSIRVWSLTSGEVLKQLVDEHQNIINSLVLNENGQLLYSCSHDHTIREWDLTDGSCTQTFKGHKSAVLEIALSRDGQFLYSGSDDGTIKEWDLTNSNCARTFEGHQSPIKEIVLSRDGQFLYSGSHDCTIKEWDLTNGNCTRTFEGHQNWVRGIALSRDGKFLYSGSQDSTIKEWDLTNGNCTRTFEGHQNWVMTIALCENSKLLYSGGHDCTIKEWDLTNGNCTRTFEGHQNWVMSIALSGNEQFLYSSSDDCTIKEWKLDNGNCQRTFQGHQNWVMAIVPTRDGKYLYSGGHDHTIKAWNTDNGICKNTFKGDESWLRTMILSRDEQFIYSGSAYGMIREWKLDQGICQRTFDGHENWVMSIAMSQDGIFLYSCSHDRTIKEWNLAEGICQRTFDGHENWVMTIAISYDRKFLYSGSTDGNIKEWNLAEGICQRTFKAHQNWVRSIVVSEDGQFLYSGSDDCTIKEWNLAKGTCQRIFKGHKSWVRALALSRDGKFLYSGGSHDRTIKQWNLETGNCQRTFEGHQSWVSSIAVSWDDRFLYSGSGDGTIKQWNTATGDCVHTIDPRLCSGANITNVKGLTPAQIDSLIALGAIDDNRK